MPENEQISYIRSQLFMNHPFYGSLAMGLEFVPTASIKTLQTNGTQLFYNPAYFASLTLEEQEFVVAHEVQHCALSHLWRRGGRDLRKFNEACDYRVNADLIDAKVGKAPKGVLYDSKYAGMYAEEIYSKRAEEPRDEPGGSQPGDRGQESSQGAGKGQEKASGDPGDGEPEQILDSPTGDFTDGATEIEEGQTETVWQVATEQAIKVAQAAGSMPGGIADGGVVKTREPKVDWVSEVREFVTNSQPADYSWAHPDRRFVGQGIYLPGVRKENTGELVVIVDTSGSTHGMLENFGSELAGIIREARPEKTHVVYCDEVVQATQEYGPDDFEIEFKPCGFGGTRSQPAFDWIKEHDIRPEGIIYLTDLELYDKPIDPGVPTLWVTMDYVRREAPGFGRVVKISKEN